MSPTSAAIFQQPLPSTPSSGSSAIGAHVGPSIHIAGWTWDVTPTDKVNSDKFFETLDPWKHGYIEGDAAVTFFSKSKLSHEDLGQIWCVPDVVFMEGA
jgi:epidermal growth factor receptor substrate 15